MLITPEPRRKRGYKVQCSECGGQITVQFFYKGKRYINANHDHDLCRKCYQAQRDRTQAAEL